MPLKLPLLLPLVLLAMPATAQDGDALRAQIAALEKQARERAVQIDRKQAEWEESFLADTAPDPALPPGLHLHYPFRPSREAAIADASGNQRGGRHVGPQGPAYIGSAMHFDGTSHIDAGRVAAFDRTDSFSLGFWIRPERGEGCLVSRRDQTVDMQGYALLLQGGRPKIHMVHRWPDNAILAQRRQPLQVGRWHHVFLTYDGSSSVDGLKLHIDGEPERLLPGRFSLTASILADTSLKIGERNGDSAYVGLIADVRIYDRRLTGEEVAALAARHPALEAVSVPRGQRTEQQRTDIQHYHRSLDSEWTRLQNKLAELRATLAEREARP